MMLRILLSLPLLFLFFQQAEAQSYTQTIRGQVNEVETLTSIPGAIIRFQSLLDQDLNRSVMADEDGKFIIPDLEIGRYRIDIQAAFFTPLVMEDVLITSAKELILDLTLKPSQINLDAVEITTNTLRGEPLNPMATVSALTITPEQTQKFAGSWDDPMRVVTAYPGVVQQSSGFNDFAIRGNSPVGMMYRLEGVPVHNPNHFAEIGSSGGFVTQFSSELLSNSDFFSSAFPAEFGNATTAVFDFRFRNGNDEKREHTFKASVFGFDFATEGPFSKNSKASYLINYRYSTLGLLAQIINLGGVRPAYQDLSFNVNIPTKRGGNVKVFGIGGLSDYLLSAETDSTKWEPGVRRVERSFGSNSGALGVAYYHPVNDQSYIHAVASTSVGRYFDNSQFLEDDLSWSTREISRLDDQRMTLAVDYNTRFNEWHSNKTGAIYTIADHVHDQALFDKSISFLDTIAQTEGMAQFVQFFSQSRFDLSEKWNVNVGLHVLHFMLNGKSGIDPRFSIEYKPNLQSRMALAYGHHSRIENLSFYFIQERDLIGNPNFVNQNIGLLKSHHGVFSYTRMLNPSLKMVMEAYYQYLYDVPAEMEGAYSVQNIYGSFPVGDLENVGKGKNYGFELMFHQFTKNGFYYMLSAAVFDSKYQTGDGIWRNTEFNQRYSYNLLAGKEWNLKPKKSKKRILGVNLNFRHSGGTWFNPVDLEASRAYGWTRYDLDNPFSQQYNSNYNLDFSLSRKISKENISSEFSISIKNLMSSRSIIDSFYDERLDEIKEREDYGTIPIIAYKVSF